MTASKQASIIPNCFFEVLEEATKIVGVNFGSKVSWKKLGDIAIYSVDRINSRLLDKANYVGVENLLQNGLGRIDSNYVPQKGNFAKFEVGDVLIGNIRPYLRKIWCSNKIGGASGDVLVIHINDEYNNKVSPGFLYQILLDENFFEYNIKFSKGAKMPRGDKRRIMEYEFPLPSLKVQEYIVSILDKFHQLAHDISDGLPKEIELRKKQHEYYREKLLSFSV